MSKKLSYAKRVLAHYISLALGGLDSDGYTEIDAIIEDIHEPVRELENKVDYLMAKQDAPRKSDVDLIAELKRERDALAAEVKVLRELKRKQYGLLENAHKFLEPVLAGGMTEQQREDFIQDLEEHLWS